MHLVYDPDAFPDPIPCGRVFGELYTPNITILDYYASGSQNLFDYGPISGSLSYGTPTIYIASEIDFWYGSAHAESSSGTMGHAGASGSVDFFVDDGDPVTLHWLWEDFEGYEIANWTIFLEQSTPEFINLYRWGSTIDPYADPPDVAEPNEGTIEIPIPLDPAKTYRLEWTFEVISNNNPGNHGTAEFSVDLTDSSTPSSYPDIEVSPTNYNFGDVAIGSSKTATINISNLDDTAELELYNIEFSFESRAAFSIISPETLPETVAPGGSVDIGIQFEPFVGDPIESAYLQISSNDPNDPLVDVFVYGCGVTSVPDIVVSPVSYDFGEVETGSSPYATINISNVGDAYLIIGSIVFSAGSSDSFSITSSPSLPTSLEPGGDIDIEITFSPYFAGAAQAVLEINSNDPDSPLVQVDLDGTGISMEPDILLSPSSYYDFGDIEIGSSVTTTAWINNTGNANLTVSSIGLSSESSSYFSITSGPALPVVIGPGQHAEVEITFTPLLVGFVQAVWQVVSDDPDESLVEATFTGFGDSVLEVTNKSITSKTKWITCNIRPLSGYDVMEINLDSIRLAGLAPQRATVRANKQLIVARFSCSDLVFPPGEGLISLILTGQMNDGTEFEGCNFITIETHGRK